MGLKSKINKIKHKVCVKGIGAIGDKTVDKITGLPSFGIFGNALKKYDKGTAHKVAIKKSYIRMKRNPNLTSGQLSDAYYKDRMRALHKDGLLHGGIIKQYFKKKR